MKPIKIRRIEKNSLGFVYGLVSDESDDDEVQFISKRPVYSILSDESDEDVIVEKKITNVCLDSPIDDSKDELTNANSNDVMVVDSNNSPSSHTDVNVPEKCVRNSPVPVVSCDKEHQSDFDAADSPIAHSSAHEKLESHHSPCPSLFEEDQYMNSSIELDVTSSPENHVSRDSSPLPSTSGSEKIKALSFTCTQNLDLSKDSESNSVTNCIETSSYSSPLPVPADKSGETVENVLTSESLVPENVNSKTSYASRENQTFGKIVSPTQSTTSPKEDENHNENSVSASKGDRKSNDDLESSLISIIPTKFLGIKSLLKRFINESTSTTKHRSTVSATDVSKVGLSPALKTHSNSISVITCNPSQTLTKSRSLSEIDTRATKDLSMTYQRLDGKKVEGDVNNLGCYKNDVANSTIPVNSALVPTKSLVGFHLPEDTEFKAVNSASNTSSHTESHVIGETHIDSNKHMPSLSPAPPSCNESNDTETDSTSTPSFPANQLPSTSENFAESSHSSNKNYLSKYNPKIRVKSFGQLKGDHEVIKSLLNDAPQHHSPDILSANVNHLASSVREEIPDSMNEFMNNFNPNSFISKLIETENEHYGILEIAKKLKEFQLLRKKYEAPLQNIEKLLRKMTNTEQTYRDYESLKNLRCREMKPCVDRIVELMRKCLSQMSVGQLLRKLYHHFNSLVPPRVNCKFPNLTAMKDILECILYSPDWTVGDPPQLFPVKELRSVVSAIRRGEGISSQWGQVAHTNTASSTNISSHPRPNSTGSHSGSSDSRPNSADFVANVPVLATKLQIPKTVPTVPAGCKCEECENKSAKKKPSIPQRQLSQTDLRKQNVGGSANPLFNTGFNGQPGMAPRHQTSSQNVPQMDTWLSSANSSGNSFHPPPPYRQSNTFSHWPSTQLANDERSDNPIEGQLRQYGCAPLRRYNSTMGNPTETQLQQYKPNDHAFGQVHQGVARQSTVPAMQKTSNVFNSSTRSSAFAPFHSTKSTTVLLHHRPKIPYLNTIQMSQSAPVLSRHLSNPPMSSNPISNIPPAISNRSNVVQQQNPVNNTASPIPSTNNQFYANYPGTTQFPNSFRYNESFASSRNVISHQQMHAQQNFRSHMFNSPSETNQNYNTGHSWPSPFMDYAFQKQDNIQIPASNYMTSANGDKPLSVQVVNSSSISPPDQSSPINVANSESSEQPISVPIVHSTGSSSPNTIPDLQTSSSPNCNQISRPPAYDKDQMPPDVLKVSSILFVYCQLSF